MGTSGHVGARRGTISYDFPKFSTISHNSPGSGTQKIIKKYRAILESDILHVRRPDARGPDCMMHVNPHLPHRGMAVVYNPLDRDIEDTLTLPLYYTGLTETARIREQEGAVGEYVLSRTFTVDVHVRLRAASATWLLIE